MAEDKDNNNAITVFGALGAPVPDKSAEPLTIDLTAIETTIEQPKSADAADAAAKTDEHRGERFAPLAASLAVAALVGAVAGAGATAGLAPTAPPAPTATAAISDESRVFQERLDRLSREVAAVKSAIEAGQNAATAQINRITERLERADKGQTEPAAKLARIAETVDRLERRALAAAAEVTGSVTSIEKQQGKPLAVEGWKLRDYHAGRALLESRNGTLFEVGPGSTLPGVGKVETIKRVDGKVVVTTPKGVIASAIEAPRRPPYHLSPGY